MARKSHNKVIGQPIISDARSRIMRAVRSKNTGPELRVRKILYDLGYRYRLHRPSLPGKPDISIAGRRKAVFVHGCFWHQHARCGKGAPPKTGLDYWQPKLRLNVERDKRAISSLKLLGWNVLVIWECETKDPLKIAKRLRAFLGPPGSSPQRRPANPT